MILSLGLNIIQIIHLVFQEIGPLIIFSVRGNANLLSDLSLLKNDISEENLLTPKDINTSVIIREKNKGNKKCHLKEKNYDSLGLAANLIRNILEGVETDVNLQLSVLEEVKNMI